MNSLLSRITCLAGFVVFLNASLFAQDRIFLKPKPDGNRGYVVELSDKHVVIRFSMEEIEKIERGPGLATSVESSGDTTPTAANSLQEAIKPLTPILSSREPAGEIVGQMLFDGQPLHECRVKLVLLQRKLLGGYTEKEDQSEIPVVTTDNTGTYRFVGIPAGPYKLKWAPKGEAFWTRKVGAKPDVMVELGHVNVVPPLEVHKYVIGR